MIPEHSGELDLTDPRVHPLAKIGAVLDDLEAWHRSSSAGPRPRSRRGSSGCAGSHAPSPSAHDQRAVRSTSRSVQSRFDRSYDWWSMGQATLAEFLQGEDDPDSLVRARDDALAGAERHPESVGGQRCRHIVAAIEAPSYSVAGDGHRRRRAGARSRSATAT